MTSQVDTSRAQINMVHDNVFLKVSQDEATKVEDEAKRRLLASKKLSLVVDLDQTIIHATVDPTIAEWQKDTENPNYEAVKDVRAFHLSDERPGARGCWYYIKMRPGLNAFLENISKLYELHIYTMGTRAYAQNIANLIDPERKIFGDRILSRDESGSLVAKNLQRLFPVDTKMVVIIDDRGDVWKWNQNLIRVTPYDFFVGIGDINSSFLPKTKPFETTTKPTVVTISDPELDAPEDVAKAEPEAKSNGDSVNQPINQLSQSFGTVAESALEQFVSMGGGDDPNVLQAQTSKQDETLAAQLQDRPLLQKQKQLDEQDAASEAAESKENGETYPSPMNGSDKHRHNLLQDDDNELYYLERALSKVHTEFFDIHARQLANVQGGRIAELRGAASNKQKPLLNTNLDVDIIPDVKNIMPSIKTRVLSGVVIVFSGVVPLGLDVQNSDIALWARNFGARVEADISGRRTTHLIAAKNRTAKVRKAVRLGKGRIKVVNTRWLMDCVSRWERLDESDYLLNTDERDIGKAFPGEEDEILSASEGAGSGLDTDAEGTDAEVGGKLMSGSRTKLTIRTGETTDDEDLEGVAPDYLEDEQSPVGGTNEDWRHMHDELAEFLGSDADDSDIESVVSTQNLGEGVNKKGVGKRTHQDISGDSSDESGTDLPERKKAANIRSAPLSQTELLPDMENGLTPEPSGESAGAGDEEEELGPEHEGDGWSDLEDDLEAEMERVDKEENG